MLDEVILVDEDAFALGTVSRAMACFTMLMASLLRIEFGFAAVALPIVSRAVLHVLIICLPVGK